MSQFGCLICFCCSLGAFVARPPPSLALSFALLAFFQHSAGILLALFRRSSGAPLRFFPGIRLTFCCRPAPLALFRAPGQSSGVPLAFSGAPPPPLARFWCSSGAPLAFFCACALLTLPGRSSGALLTFSLHSLGIALSFHDVPWCSRHRNARGDPRACSHEW